MKNEINLLSEDFAMPREIRLKNFLRIALVFFVLFIFFFSFFYLEYRKEALVGQIEDLERESYLLKAKMVSLEEREREITLQRLAEDNKEELREKAIPWRNHVEEISLNSGENLAVTYISASEGGNLKIEGASLTLEEVASFARRLSDLPFINDSVVERIESGKEIVYEDTETDNEELEITYYFFSLSCCFL